MEKKLIMSFPQKLIFAQAAKPLSSGRILAPLAFTLWSFGLGPAWTLMVGPFGDRRKKHFPKNDNKHVFISNRNSNRQ